MKARWALILSLLFAGCERKMDYSVYADKNRPHRMAMASLDGRLRFLLGDRTFDSTRLTKIFDTLDGMPALDRTSVTDSDMVRRVSRTLMQLGLVPVLQPNDSDLVPSLAWERRRAGCVPLALFWTSLLRRQGLHAEAVLLPGHVAVSLEASRWLEPLRQGIFRDEKFYDSAFHLAQRPYYRGLHPDSNALLASMLVQAGLLEWRKNHPGNAASAFGAASKICQRFPEAEGNLGLVLEEQGKTAEAVEHLRIAVDGDRMADAAEARLNRLKSMGQAR